MIRSNISEVSNISYQSFSLLDNYMYHELKLEQVDIFEHLILNMIVACGLLFSWIEIQQLSLYSSGLTLCFFY